MKPRRILAAGAAIGAALTAYAALIEPRWIQLRRAPVHIRSLPSVLEGLKVGIVSDLHVKGDRSLEVVRRAAGLLMDEAPDIIAIAGDFGKDEPALRAVLDVLSALRAPLGVFAVPGNHDYAAGIAAWHETVRRARGIHDLTNRYRTVEHRSARICIGGVDDFEAGRPRLVLPPPETRDLTVVLAHSPDQAEHCRRAYDAVDLIVSGHTHGGQVRLPFLRAPINSARRSDLYEQGLRRRPWTQVYVSRGLGTSRLPLRFFARPEVSVLTLTRAPRGRRGSGVSLQSSVFSQGRGGA